MDQNHQNIHCDEEFCFGSRSLAEQFIIFLIESKHYKVYVPNYMITISDLIDWLTPNLKEIGVIIHPDLSLYYNHEKKQLPKDQPIRNFLPDILYIEVIELGKNKIFPNFQHILDHEIEYLLKTQLKPNEIISLKTILECRKLGKNQPFLAYPLKDAINEINVLIFGPPNTPYQGGVFELIWEFQESYINKPRIYLKTPIYHPNFEKKNYISNFSSFQPSDPGRAFQNQLYSIIYFLGQPNHQVMNKECAQLYKQNIDEYRQRAINYTQKYTNPAFFEKYDVLGSNQQLNFEDLFKQSQIFFESQKWRDFQLSLETYKNLSNHFALDNGTTFQKRLLNEFFFFQIQDQTEMFKMFPINYDLHGVRVYFLGPKKSPYGGGIYKLDLIFPQSYPYKPPHCELKTQIYHPNIKNNFINIDILSENNWSEALSIRTIILSIISLLDDPNPTNSYDLDCSQLYLNDRDSYNKKVEEYKVKYASPTIDQINEDILELETQKHFDKVYLGNILKQWIQYWKDIEI